MDVDLPINHPLPTTVPFVEPTQEQEEVGTEWPLPKLDNRRTALVNARQAGVKEDLIGEMDRLLHRAPGVAAYGARGPEQAKAVSEHGPALAAVEFYLTGRIDHVPATSSNPRGEVEHQPMLAQIFDRVYSSTTAALWRTWLEAGGAGDLTPSEKFGGAPRPGEEQAKAFREQHKAMIENELSQLEAAGSAKLEGADTAPRKVISAVAHAAGSAAPYVAAAYGGPAAEFALMHAQSYGHMRNIGVDPQYASGAAVAAATVGTLTGRLFLAGLAGQAEAREAQSAVTGAVTEMVAKPAFAKLAKDYSRHVASAVLMNVGMGEIESLAQRADEAHKSGKPMDWSAALADLREHLKGSLAMLPLALVGPVQEHLQARGEWLEAQESQIKLRGASVSSGLAQKLASAELREAVSGMNAPDVLIDAEGIRQAARTAKIDPQALAMQATHDDGSAWHAANLYHTPLWVSMADFLSLRDYHEKLLPYSKIAGDKASEKSAEINLNPAEERKVVIPKQEPIPLGFGKSQATAEKFYAKSVIANSTIGALRSTEYKRAPFAPRSPFLPSVLEKERVAAVKSANVQETLIDAQRAQREQAWEAGERHGKALDSLLAALKKSDGPLDAAALDRLARETGAPMDFDRHLLNAILRKPRTFEDLRPAEAAEVDRAFRALSDARLKEVRDQRRDAESVHQLRELSVLSHLAERPWTKYQEGTKAGSLETRRAELANSESLLYRLGPVGRVLADRLQTALTKESEMRGQMAALLSPTVPKGLDGSEQVPMMDLDRSVGSPLANQPHSIPRSDLWVMQALAGSHEGMRALTEGFGKTEAQIETFLRSNIKTRAEMDFVQRLLDTGRESGGQEIIEKSVRRRFGPRAEDSEAPEGPRQTTIYFNGEKATYPGGGFPLRFYENGDGTPAVSPKDPLGGLRSGEGGETGERAPVADLRFSQLGQFWRAAIHDTTHSDLVLDMDRLFGRQMFQDTVRQKLGDPWLQQLKEVQRVATLGYEGTLKTGAKWYEGVFRQLISQAAQSAFDYNPRVAAGQSAHLLVAKSALDLSTRHVAIGVAKSLSPEGIEEAMSESEVVPFRHERYVDGMNEVLSLAAGAERNGVLEALRGPSQWVYGQIDHQLSLSIWHASKVKALEAGASYDDAVLTADRSLRRVMPAISAEQTSSFHRNHGIIGALFMVRGFPNAVYNAEAMARWDAVRDIDRGVSSYWPRQVKLASTVLGVTGGLAVGRYLMGHGKREDESYKQAALRVGAEELFYPLPFGSVAAHVAVPLMLGEKLRPEDLRLGEWAGGGNVVSGLKSLWAVGRAVSEGQFDAKALRESVNAAGRAFGFPPPAIFPEVRAGVGIAQEALTHRGQFKHRERGPLDYWSLLSYGEHPETDPFYDAQTFLRWFYGGK